MQWSFDDLFAGLFFKGTIVGSHRMRNGSSHFDCCFLSICSNYSKVDQSYFLSQMRPHFQPTSVPPSFIEIFDH
jgi:hypothetical protein